MVSGPNHPHEPQETAKTGNEPADLTNLSATGRVDSYPELTALAWEHPDLLAQLRGLFFGGDEELQAQGKPAPTAKSWILRSLFTATPKSGRKSSPQTARTAHRF
jgi:hypothetical protein